MIATTPVDETLPLDPTCPICREPHDVDEVFDGSERRCGSCGHTLVCVTYQDGSAYMQCYANCRDCEAAERTGRKRTRARWKRQGRRG